MKMTAHEYLTANGMEPEKLDPSVYAPLMAAEMKEGLEKENCLPPMIPTFLRFAGDVPKNKPVVVIDAGGTNFRTGLLTFTDKGYTVDHLQKRKMPGIGTPATWEEFISLVADSIQPLLADADDIGFCFSYNAEITPEIDGRVVKIDKEVIITGCEGHLVAADLIAELEKRGVHGKHAVILNDTAAVLLGGTASMDKTSYSSFIGQVSGTGTNTCCLVSDEAIAKIGLTGTRKQIVNCESGTCTTMPRGRFDKELDEHSAAPGEKFFEKMTAGVYQGELCRLILNAAADDGILSAYTAENVHKLVKPDSSVIDAWSIGENLAEFCDNDDDRTFLQEISKALFERSARCMCTNLLAISILTDSGKEAEHPVCVCAEGSLVQKSHCYHPMLEQFLDLYGAKKLGRHVKLVIGNESTLPGAGAAALLNK